MSRAAPPYANPNVFLFMGGFILALAMQRWGLHRRVALHVIRCLGASESAIVLGFMAASAGLSMWISNTATAMMLLPIGLAVIHTVPAMPVASGNRGDGRFAAALMLGIAYAASIGGLATPIGTPPNIAFRGQVASLFPDAPEISFAQWTLVCLPLVLVLLPIAWLVLVRITCPVRRGRPPRMRRVIDEELRELGPMRRPERAVAAVFACTAVLWMTRRLPIGDAHYGWSRWLERWLSQGPAASGFRADYIDDASVALLAAVMLFVLPAGRTPEGRGQRLMDWDTARQLPWGILLLFGGGFSIAEGFSSSGLSRWCGQAFADVGISSPVLLVLGTCLLITFLTEITSNTATSQVMLPILSRVAVAMQVHPLLLMLPATLSASCAFMLPVATPPNAIVFGSGHVRMRDMIRSGLVLNLVGAAVITAMFHLVIGPMLGVAEGVPPEWADAVSPSADFGAH